MFLQRKLLLLLLFISISYPTCFGHQHKHSGNIKNRSRNSHHGCVAKLPHVPKHSRARRREAPTKSVNVDYFGATADGGDDTVAFRRAWGKACSSRGKVHFVVPKDRVYHVKPTRFSGPCNSALVMKIYGTIKASIDMSDYRRDRRHWLVFENIQNFRVEGKGIINGNGKIWWDKSCKVNTSLPCQDAPTAVTFHGCKKLTVANLWFQNAQKMHLTFQKCVGVRARKLVLTAPEKSPNTDGIHVTGSQNVQIENCVIRTGDDCISIVSGSKNVRATGITCGPGHGISIGSLGAGNSTANVSNILVQRAKLSGTTNGVRIKTWQGGSGYARDIVFRDVIMHNVSNPIIINQNYCDQEQPCPEQKSAVRISNVVYGDIRGTSASEVAIKFDCSKTVPCKGIYMRNIDLKREGDGSAQASCEHVTMAQRGEVSPKCP